jgi:hypothetical protein
LELFLNDEQIGCDEQTHKANHALGDNLTGIEKITVLIEPSNHDKSIQSNYHFESHFILSIREQKSSNKISRGYEDSIDEIEPAGGAIEEIVLIDVILQINAGELIDEE